MHKRKPAAAKHVISDSSLNRNSDPERNDEARNRYKQLLDTVGLLVLVVGLYFAWDQAKQFNHSQNLSNWSEVSARMLEVDKVFIDCNGSQSFPPISSRYFPASFSDSFSVG
jgi:hypothetical protein